eukprot:COSAG05_NODE_3894_length_1784_cov_1.566172_1_plen_160_part_00
MAHSIPELQFNVSIYGARSIAMESIAVDAFLKDQILRITAAYDVEEGGWGVRSCAEAHMTITIPNVSGNPYLNVSMGFGHDAPTEEPYWYPWIGPLQPEKGYINASFDPRLSFGGVHISNWVEQGNITVRDLSSTHTGACGYNRPCAHQYVGKSQSCML